MVEIRKVFRAGNSLVVSLPKQAIKALELAEGTPLALQINPDKRQITLQLIELEARSGQGSKYAQMVEDFISKYESVIEELG